MFHGDELIVNCKFTELWAFKVGIIVTTPTTTQHNLNTVVGLDTKMPLHITNHPPTTETQL